MENQNEDSENLKLFFSILVSSILSAFLSLYIYIKYQEDKTFIAKSIWDQLLSITPFAVKYIITIVFFIIFASFLGYAIFKFIESILTPWQNIINKLINLIIKRFKKTNSKQSNKHISKEYDLIEIFNLPSIKFIYLLAAFLFILFSPNIFQFKTVYTIYLTILFIPILYYFFQMKKNSNTHKPSNQP